MGSCLAIARARRHNDVGRNIVVVADAVAAAAHIELDKENDRSVFQRGKETVVHSLAESDSACIGVECDGRHDSNINFIYDSITVARFVDSKLLTLQRQSKWYHLETDVFHKRQIDLHLPRQGPEQFAKIGLDGERPVEEDALRAAFSNEPQQSAVEFRLHVLLVVAGALLHLFEAVPAQGGFVHVVPSAGFRRLRLFPRFYRDLRYPLAIIAHILS